jgi:hypothetical protein
MRTFKTLDPVRILNPDSFRSISTYRQQLWRLNLTHMGHNHKNLMQDAQILEHVMVR